MLRRALIALTVSLSLLVSSVAVTGCYGKFALTRKVYDWNGGLGNKFLKSIVFWALVIIPVYEIAGLADVVIFNLLEFWTGSNPIASTDAITTRQLADGSLEIQHGEATYLLTTVGTDKLQVRRDGAIIGVAELQEDGSVALTDLAGERTMRIPAAQIEELRAHVGA